MAALNAAQRKTPEVARLFSLCDTKLTTRTLLTKGANSVQPVSVLHTVQLHTLSIPVFDLASGSPLLFGAPRDVVDYTRYCTRTAVPYEIQAALSGSLFKEREKKRVRVGGSLGRHVFLVEDVVQERGELDGQQVWLFVVRQGG